MRGFKTLKARFVVKLGPVGLHACEVTVGHSLTSVYKHDDSIGFAILDVTTEEHNRYRLGTVFDLTLNEGIRLLEFLDVAIQEQQRRVALRIERGEPEPAVAEPPSVPSPRIPSGTPIRWYCDVCNGAYSPTDVQWDPRVALYVCSRNREDIWNGRVMSPAPGISLRTSTNVVRVRQDRIERGEPV